MENPTYKQLQDFATKTAELSVKKLGFTEVESDLVYNVLMSTLDWMAGYPSKDEQR